MHIFLLKGQLKSHYNVSEYLKIWNKLIRKWFTIFAGSFLIATDDGKLFISISFFFLFHRSISLSHPNFCSLPLQCKCGWYLFSSFYSAYKFSVNILSDGSSNWNTANAARSRPATMNQCYFVHKNFLFNRDEMDSSQSNETSYFVWYFNISYTDFKWVSN